MVKILIHLDWGWPRRAKIGPDRILPKLLLGLLVVKRVFYYKYFLLLVVFICIPWHQVVSMIILLLVNMLMRQYSRRTSSFSFHASIVAFCLASTICLAEYKLAVINDPDGYTNVRKAPDAKSEVVFKIEKDEPLDELFLCEPTKGQWFKAKDFFGNQGFIHKSRVFLYKDLEEKKRETLKGSWLDAVTDRVMYRKESTPHKEYPDLYYGSFDIQRVSKQFSLHTGDCEGAHRMDLLFLGEDTPEALLKSCTAHPDRDIQKLKKALPALLSESPPTTEGFKTQRGLVIGSTTNDAIRLYGNPHDKKTEDGVEILTWFWSYSMDLPKNIRLLEKEDSLWRFRSMQERQGGGASFEVTMYFRQNKLIGLKFLRDTGGC